MRSILLVALAAFAMVANAEDSCSDHDAFNAQYGGRAQCEKTSENLPYTYVKGECAKDKCYVWGTNSCASGCADLMGSWDCPTVADCEAAQASSDHVGARE